ncbi:MAG: ABC transporter permease, partial [Desulfobacterales bacterium]|nr:ABC transporter permease [Desulfobacterales bacterium]
MFINYLKSAIRNISRHKVSSFISVMGLAAGMAFSTPILLWGAREMSYDRFHENKNEIYRVLQEIDLKNHRRKWALTQGPLGPALKKEIPEIINACRVKGRSFLITRNDKRSIEPVGMTDPSISEMFTFPLTQGDPAAAIREPDSIIISEAAAEKYFGDEDPVGQALWLDLEYEFRVTGVMKNIPWNSSLRADFVIPIDFDRERSDSLDRWNNSDLFTFVQLDKTADPADVVQKISTFLAGKPVSPENARLNLQPLLTLRRSSDVEFDSFSSA